MRRTFESERVIEAPVESVFALLADPTSQGKWRSDPEDADMREVVTVERTEGATDDVGSSYRRTTSTGRRQEVEEFTMVAREPDRLVAFEGPWRSGVTRTSYRLEPLGDGTRVTVNREMEASGLRERLIGKMLGGSMGEAAQQSELGRLERAVTSA